MCPGWLARRLDLCLLGEVWRDEGRVCVRCGVARRLPAPKTMFVGIWGFEGVSWIVDLSCLARRGNKGVAFVVVVWVVLVCWELLVVGVSLLRSG